MCGLRILDRLAGFLLLALILPFLSMMYGMLKIFTNGPIVETVRIEKADGYIEFHRFCITKGRTPFEIKASGFLNLYANLPILINVVFGELRLIEAISTIKKA